MLGQRGVRKKVKSGDPTPFILKELNFMVEKNILRRIGEGRNTRYELND
jgi:hypothetical protein